MDKQNHRLAVVSGSIILRNYAVGLGGDKTPEGNFVITDKVVNPNGRDDGDFGSRGFSFRTVIMLFMARMSLTVLVRMNPLDVFEWAEKMWRSSSR